MHDVPAIMRLLDPIRSAGTQTAVTFEGIYYRGEVMGGQWSWNRCVYPYEHSEPFGAKPCPG